MESFCINLKEYATKIINYEKKEMIALTDEENKSYKKQKVCDICKKGFTTDENDKNAFKLYHKVSEIIVTIQENIEELSHSICNLRYKTPKEIPVVFHNGSTYDYHFIINELSNKSEVQFECLGENTEKYITFSLLIKKNL